MFSPDSPIQTAKEDKLGRQTFALALAKAIATFSGEDSFVIGIHGKWGTGKSSILNLVVEQIAEQDIGKADEDKLHILRFNPWNFSDQNQLIFQFLRQFRTHLTGKKKGLGDLINSLDDYAEALTPPLELLPYGSLFSSGVKVGVKGAQKLLGSTKDVNTLFDQIATQSRKLKRRTVVLIDDIDRLMAAETRQIFQLVKLTARFPYVIYVLAFDREAVAAALKQSGMDSGEEYLEKIVQVTFDIPPVSEASLTSFITSSLDELLKTYKPANFDSTRFGNLFHAGFRKSFHSLRDVRRFINGLEFGLGLIGHELNAVDFIGIETVRIFYPRTFGIIRTNKDVFAGHVDSLTESAGAEKYAAQVNDLLKSTGELTEDLKDVLLELFPKLTNAFGKVRYGHTSETEWEKTFRIGSQRYFDAYFALVLTETEVSVQDVASFVASSNSQASLEEFLVRWAQKGKLKNGTESLRYRLTEVPGGNLRNVFAALLTAGDMASEKGVIFAGQIPEYWNVRWAIFDVLDKLPAEERVGVVKEIFTASSSFKTMSNVIALIQETKEKNATRYGEFTEDDIQQLKRITVSRISGAAKDTPALIQNNAALPGILQVWKNWGAGEEEAKTFVDRITRTDKDLIKFVDAFIYQTHSSAGRILQTKNHLSMKSLSQWWDLVQLTDRLKGLRQEELNEAEREILKIALSELDQMKSKGLTPEQFDGSRFFD